MQLDGITWHALTLEPEDLETTRKLLTEIPNGLVYGLNEQK